jgi:hypothetical protein
VRRKTAGESGRAARRLSSSGPGGGRRMETGSAAIEGVVVRLGERATFLMARFSATWAGLLMPTRDTARPGWSGKLDGALGVGSKSGKLGREGFREVAGEAGLDRRWRCR